MKRMFFAVILLAGCNLSNEAAISDASILDKDVSTKDTSVRDVPKADDQGSEDVGRDQKGSDDFGTQKDQGSDKDAAQMSDVADLVDPLSCSFGSDCPDEFPRCIVGTCKECIDDNDCGEGTCNQGDCMFECETDGDCEGSGKPICVSRECVECTQDTDCSETGNCENQVCRPCTSDADCSGNRECSLGGSCERNPGAQCESCNADTDCKLNHHCIAMNYLGAPHGRFCLQVSSSPSFCPDRYKTAITRASVDGAGAVSHCGIEESLTTCEAVSLPRPCGNGGAPDPSLCAVGARCELIAGVNTPYICTYSCNNNNQCGQGLTCNQFCQAP